MVPLNNDGNLNNDAEAETTRCANAEENVDNSVSENLCDDVYFDCDSVPRYDSSAGLYDIRDYESSSDSSDDETISFNLQNALAAWAVQFSITLCVLSALLLILRVFHPELPKDARTILKTKRNYAIERRAGGGFLFWYRQFFKKSVKSVVQ